MTSSPSFLPQQKQWKDTELIAQGAEGRVYVVQSSQLASPLENTNSSPPQFLNQDKFIYKHRLSKPYRHPDLDKSILSSRLTAEARNILRALQCGVETPYVWRVENDGLWMEYIHGISLRLLFDDLQNRDRHLELCKRIGKDIAQMHASNLIHGDLTTSNLMIRYKSGVSVNDRSRPSVDVIDWDRPVFIDFGLSYVSAQIEDKAVDLYVLERAIVSTHKEASNLFKAIQEGYSSQWEDAPKILEAYEAVRMRGRKREMIG